MLLWFDILSPLCTMTRPNCTTFWDGEISPLIALAAYLQRATAPTISFAITWKRLNTCLKYTLRLRSYHERLISVSITAVFKLFWFFLGIFFRFIHNFYTNCSYKILLSFTYIHGSWNYCAICFARRSYSILYILYVY